MKGIMSVSQLPGWCQGGCSSHLCLTRKNSRVSSPDDPPSSVELYSMCHTKEAGVLWSSALHGPCGIMWSRYLSPSTQGTQPTLPVRPLGDSVYLQLPRRINLDSVHSRAVQSRTCVYRTGYVNIVLYISSSNNVFWYAPAPPQMVYPPSTDCCSFFGLISHTME